MIEYTVCVAGNTLLSNPGSATGAHPNLAFWVHASVAGPSPLLITFCENVALTAVAVPRPLLNFRFRSRRHVARAHPTATKFFKCPLV